MITTVYCVIVIAVSAMVIGALARRDRQLALAAAGGVFLGLAVMTALAATTGVI